MDNSKVKPNNYLFALPFLLLDIILFPVSSFYSLPYSIIAVIFFLFKYLKKQVLEKTNIKITAIIFILCIITSTLFSLFFKEKYTIIKDYIGNGYIGINVLKEDIKRSIYLLVGLAIYRISALLYQDYKDKLDKHITRILLAVCWTFSIMSIIFIINIDLFYHIKGIFFTVDVNMLNYKILNNAGYLKRFNFILLDPNNATYYILSIAMFLLENASIKRSTRIAIWLMMVYSVLITMSLGGAYVLLIYIIIKIITTMFRTKYKFNKVTVMLTTLTFLLIALFLLLDQFVGNGLVNKFIELISPTLDRWSINSMSGRTERFKYLLLESLPPLIGNGYVIIREGAYFLPHSDHLRFLYSYGIISYTALLALIIRRRTFSHQYLFMIPIFTAFSINSLIDETRLMFTFIILFAIVNSKTAIQSIEIIQKKKVEDIIALK